MNAFYCTVQPFPPDYVEECKVVLVVEPHVPHNLRFCARDSVVGRVRSDGVIDTLIFYANDATACMVCSRVSQYVFLTHQVKQSTTDCQRAAMMSSSTALVQCTTQKRSARAARMTTFLLHYSFV